MQQLPSTPRASTSIRFRPHETADGVSLIPYRSSPKRSSSSIPRSVLQCVVVSLAEEIKPIRPHEDTATSEWSPPPKSTSSLPRRAVVRLLVEVVVAATEEDVDQVRPS